MKKITFVFATVLLILAACNTAPKDTEVADEQTGVNEVEQNVDLQSDTVEDDGATNGDAAESESNGDLSKNGDTAEKPTTDNGQSAEEQSNAWDKPDKIDNMKHLDIVHLAYDIFAAQDRKDYDFLKSVAAKGTTVHTGKDKFSFENVTYPFEMEFFTKEDLATLELRYTHEEDNIVHVGFGAINYEEESSFVVEFEFVKEDGAWKLLSMDINA